MKDCAYLWVYEYFADLFLEWEMFQGKLWLESKHIFYVG
jgi:hypothetical protein